MDALLPILEFATGHPLLSFVIVGIGLTAIFGKRIENRFDLEAEFYNDQHREMAEFETKSWREKKSDGPYQFAATFKWRDPSLAPADEVEVFLDDDLVLRGAVAQAGRVRLGRDDVQKELTEARPGQICRVFRNKVEVMSQPVVLD